MVVADFEVVVEAVVVVDSSEELVKATEMTPMAM